MTDDKCPKRWGRPNLGGCPPETPKKVVITRRKIVIKDKVFFARGKSRIKRRSYRLLRDVASVLVDNPWIKKVRVEGHTSDRGGREMNMRLSQKRAEAVRAFLIKRGVAGERLDATGFGPDRPLMEGKSRKARARNRRVEFSIVEQPVPEPKPAEEPEGGGEGDDEAAGGEGDDKAAGGGEGDDKAAGGGEGGDEAAGDVDSGAAGEPAAEPEVKPAPADADSEGGGDESSASE